MKPWPEAMRSRCSLLMVTAVPLAGLGAADLSSTVVRTMYRRRQTTLSAAALRAAVRSIWCNMSAPPGFPASPPVLLPMHASLPAPLPVPAARPEAALGDFIARHRRLFVLTGAGISTGSGIPDYRDADGG